MGNWRAEGKGRDVRPWGRAWCGGIGRQGWRAPQRRGQRPNWVSQEAFVWGENRSWALLRESRLEIREWESIGWLMVLRLGGGLG